MNTKQRRILGSQIIEVATMLIILLGLTAVAHAQTYNVIYNFTGGTDGAFPQAGVMVDQGGNLYGTASYGGYTGGQCTSRGCGTVYRLKHLNSAWVLNPLYAFLGQNNDGAIPYARVVFGPDGSLYGTTAFGGPPDEDCEGRGCGTVFNLKPPPTACKTSLCPWTEAVLFYFSNELNLGADPYYGDLIFDAAGNIYGSASETVPGWGGVFELSLLNGNWTESRFYEFPQNRDQGALPWAGTIFDSAGNLYGTAYTGGPHNSGVVYELMPSGSGWAQQILYAFEDGSDGADPVGGLIFDQSGNLYGTTRTGGTDGGGTVYQLSPSSNGWTLTTLYSFSGSLGSFAILTMDASGNLYGTTYGDGAYGYGNVFKLTNSNGSWSYTSLHDFTGGSDGGQPLGQVTFDASGNLYGTASAGGANGDGVVWEINP